MSLQTGLFSRSETDLHKPKRFATLSFFWKKKKNKNLSQSSSSISEDSEVRGHIIEPEEDDKTDQTSLRQPVHSEVPEIESVDNDAGRMQDEDPKAAEVMLASTEGTSISYMDDSASGSDGYCTPPESPDLGSSPSLIVNNAEMHRSYSKECEMNLEQSSVTAIHGTVEEGSSLSGLTATEISHTSSLNSPARTYEGHLTPIIPTPTSTVASSVNSSLITGHHLENSAGAESRDQSLAIHQWDTPKNPTQRIGSPDSTSQRDVVEKFEEVNANLALGSPEQSSSQLNETTDSENRPAYDRDVSLYKPVVESHRECSHVFDDTIPGYETFQKNEENVDYIAGPHGVLSFSCEAPGELVPVSCPDDPESIYSTSEIYSSSFGENVGNTASADVPLVYLETDLSPPLTRRSTMVSDPDPDPDSATFDLSGFSDTSGLNHSNNSSDLLSEPDHPMQAQEPREPQEQTIFSSLSFDTFNKSLSPESISAAGTDHLTRYSYISDPSHRSFSEDPESETFKGNNLEADKCEGEETEEISAQGLFSRSSEFKQTCYLLEETGPRSFTGNNDAVCETEMHGNVFYTINNNWNESDNRKYSQGDGNAMMLNTEENFTGNQESDTVEPRTVQNQDMLSIFPITTKIEENVEEKSYVQDRVVLRDEGDTQVHLSGESEAPQGEVNPQLEDLTIMKPDTPVLQVCVSEECVPAPPCSLHAEVSETHPCAEAWPSHSQKTGSPIPSQWEDSTGGGANSNVVRLHVDREDINAQEPETRSVTYYRVTRFESAEPRGLPETRDTFQQIQEQQNSTDQEHQDLAGNPNLQLDSSRDTCGIFTERSKTQGGVVVCIREFGEEEEDQVSRRERTISNHQPAPRYSSQ